MLCNPIPIEVPSFLHCCTIVGNSAAGDGSDVLDDCASEVKKDWEIVPLESEVLAAKSKPGAHPLPSSHLCNPRSSEPVPRSVASIFILAKINQITTHFGRQLRPRRSPPQPLRILWFLLDDFCRTALRNCTRAPAMPCWYCRYPQSQCGRGWPQL